MTNENIEPIRDWMPGLPGKGFMLESGQIVLWNIDKNGHPEHAEKAYSMTGRRHDYTGAITISHDGTACRASLLTQTPLPADGDEVLVAGANGHIKLVEDPEQVTKAKLHAYAHAENLAVIAARKAAPAKLGEMPEEIAQWLAKLPAIQEKAKADDTLPIYDEWSFTFGTKTWTTPYAEEGYGIKLRSLLPATCSPRGGVLERQRADAYSADGTVWGPSTFWLRIYVPCGTPKRLHSVLTHFLSAKLVEMGSELISYPGFSMPSPYKEIAHAKHEAKEEAKEAAILAAEEARKGTPEECEAVLTAMNDMRNPDKHRTFTCQLDIERASGVPADRIDGVMETLSRKKIIHSGGFYTRAKKDGREMGYWWSITNPKPLAKV